MDRVDADMARPALRLGCLAQTDVHGRALGLRPRRAHGAVGRRGAQVVDVPVGDRREARVVRLAEHLEQPPQNLARGQPGHLLVGLVDLRQPPDVRRRVRARERPAAVPAAAVPDRSGLAPLPHQPLHLLERHACRGDQEPQNHPVVALAEPPVAEAVQRVPHEAVRLVAILGFEVHSLVAFHEGPKVDRKRSVPDCA